MKRDATPARGGLPQKHGEAAAVPVGFDVPSHPKAEDDLAVATFRDARGNRYHAPRRPFNEAAEAVVGRLELDVERAKTVGEGASAHPKVRQSRSSTSFMAVGPLTLAVLTAVAVRQRWVAEVEAALDRQTAPPVAEIATVPASLPSPIADPVEVEKSSGAARVRRNESGEIVAVLATNPEALLRAWCAAREGCDSSTLAVLPASSDAPEKRIGRFRDFVDLSQDRALVMFRARRGHGWVAGDGNYPVPVFAASSFDDRPR